jgi:EAL domain-containing protein (putative c-di-GMP-specific phosphodiesterase class I)
MYHAKQHRAGSIEYFREELNAREIERARWIAELQQALAGDELELAFLPKASCADGRLCGVEALLQWRHPRLGLIPARAFLPDLADRELLNRLDEWTIGAACAQAALWRRSALPVPVLPISVNLAALQIDPELAPRVLSHLDNCGLAPGWLELEIAEPLLLGAVAVAPVLRALHEGGVRLAVDDFGSAGASLATLRDLPLDVLKIDRAFVDDVASKAGADMAAAIIHLGRALGLTVLAQGVCSDDQLRILDTLGCDQYQGDLFSKPLQAAPMLALLLSHPLPLPKNEEKVDE